MEKLSNIDLEISIENTKLNYQLNEDKPFKL